MFIVVKYFPKFGGMVEEIRCYPFYQLANAITAAVRSDFECIVVDGRDGWVLWQSAGLAR